MSLYRFVMVILSQFIPLPSSISSGVDKLSLLTVKRQLLRFSGRQSLTVTARYLDRLRQRGNKLHPVFRSLNGRRLVSPNYCQRLTFLICNVYSNYCC